MAGEPFVARHPLFPRKTNLHLCGGDKRQSDDRWNSSDKNNYCREHFVMELRENGAITIAQLRIQVLHVLEL